jgi:hypothetical protein
MTRICNRKKNPMWSSLPRIEAPRKTEVSELVLSDRLISLAEDADRAGYTDTAERLVTLACSVFDEAVVKKPH